SGTGGSGYRSSRISPMRSALSWRFTAATLATGTRHPAPGTRHADTPTPPYDPRLGDRRRRSRRRVPRLDDRCGARLDKEREMATHAGRSRTMLRRGVLCAMAALALVGA